MIPTYARLKAEIEAADWPDHTGLGPSNNCIEWNHDVSSGGYGQVWAGGRLRRVHSLAWILSGGSDPTGFAVKQTCLNKVCYRPSHLCLGAAEG